MQLPGRPGSRARVSAEAAASSVLDCLGPSRKKSLAPSPRAGPAASLVACPSAPADLKEGGIGLAAGFFVEEEMILQLQIALGVANFP